MCIRDSADYLATAGDGLGTAPVDGAIVFRKGEAVVTEPVVGRGLDEEAARSALVAAYLTEDGVELPLVEVVPDIDADDIATALEEFATPAMSAPVTLRFGESEVTLKPRQYARALRLVPQDGSLVPTLGSKALAKQLAGLVSSDGAEPVDAQIRLLAGKPRVIPAKPGVSFDPAALDLSLIHI